jgi:hypothetical protein
VVGAHPDDETLGAGGLVHLAARAGLRVVVVSATAGEGSHPGSPTHDAHALATRRRGELERAVALLAPDADVVCLDHPDGALADLEEELVAALVATIGTTGERTVLVAPWRRDGHPDHEAVGRAAAVAARRTDARTLEYPVWAWHWGTAADLPWDEVRLVRLDAAAGAHLQRGGDRGLGRGGVERLDLRRDVLERLRAPGQRQPAHVFADAGRVAQVARGDDEGAALDRDRPRRAEHGQAPLLLLHVTCLVRVPPLPEITATSTPSSVT